VFLELAKREATLPRHFHDPAETDWRDPPVENFGPDMLAALSTLLMNRLAPRPPRARGLPSLGRNGYSSSFAMGLGPRSLQIAKGLISRSFR